ncbi:ATP-grasp fold amidoligase family protein [Vibrio sp. 1978]|uniref:ATP-grasp fold amidoligase family protein n=1 Tax=Vibrio sp. 1978 TaxID=3074585 RepID=UPI0029670A88|nr:ATP-grasp fold amidoligase family protein [Vibrio sp. 1978]MDW3056447.1 ATP-grasp fold amidoligase family protein [Vibrio sp. 1978]
MKKKVKNLLRIILPTVAYDTLAFVTIFKRFPFSNEPKYFNQKVFMRKYFDRNYLYSLCSDKYRVREYIERKIGKVYLIELISSFKGVPEVSDFIRLKRFVAKSNHGAGMVHLVDSPLSDEQAKELVNEFESWMTIDYGKDSSESQYRKIPKMIVLEESLCVDGKVPRDYKFHCFNQMDGTYKYVLQVVDGRFADESRGYYLNNLEDCVHSFGNGNHVIPSTDLDALKEIVHLNGELIKDFDYVRIDWYVSEGRPYFGELTFTPGGGLSSEFNDELELTMGEYWL